MQTVGTFDGQELKGAGRFGSFTGSKKADIDRHTEEEFDFLFIDEDDNDDDEFAPYSIDSFQVLAFDDQSYHDESELPSEYYRDNCRSDTYI